MRKLMAFAIVLTFAASTKSWALVGLGNVSFDGSLEVSGNAANNERDFGNDPAGGSTNNDGRGNTATRVRVGMNAQVTEGAMGRIEAVRTPRLYGTAATTVTGEEALWSFQNAFVQLDDLWGLKARLGRQYTGNQGDLVWNFSPKMDDSLTVTSIDGLLLQSRRWDFINVDLFTGKSSEDDTIATTDVNDAAGDVNLTNLQVDLPKLLPGGVVGIGYLRGDDANSNLDNDNNHLQIIRLGAKGNLKDNMWTYRAEYLMNTGEFQGAGLSNGVADKLKYEGNAIDLGVGFNSPETSVGTFGLSLNWVMASGDDNLSDNKDKSFHDFTGLGVNTSDRYFGEIFGKSNVLGGAQGSGSPLGQGIDTANAAAPNAATQGLGLQVINLGVNYKPSFVEKTTARLDYYMFSTAEDSFRNAANTASVSQDDKLGNEIDLTLGYAHTDNIGFELGYAMLMPDDGLVGNITGFKADGSAADNSKDDAVTKLFARANIRWGGAAE